MIYAKVKSKKEWQRLYDALWATKDKKWYRRLRIIELSAQEYCVQGLSSTFKLCEATIRKYIHSYNRGGLDALTPRKSPGRRPKIAHWTKEHWDMVLEQTPNQYKKLKTHSGQWTLERLRLYLKEYHQIDVSISSIQKSLRKDRNVKQ